jgi:hypothetical protein
LALAVAVIYVYVPLSHEEIAKIRWLDDINVVISKVLAPATREVRVVSVYPVAAANLDDDLDYRIAQRMKSIEGWRSFLAVHPEGPRAQSARAELDKLVGAQTAPAPELVQASNNGSPEMKTPSEAASRSQPSPGFEVATPTTDEVCRRDEDRLERVSNSRLSDEAKRFLTELRCEKLRPQLLALMKSLDHAPSPPAVAHPRPSVEVGLALSQERRPPVHPDRRRWTPLHSPQPRELANTRRVVDQHPQYVVTMWLDCPVDETGNRPPLPGCLLVERP